MNLFIGLLIIKSYCQDIIFPSDEEVTHLSGNKVLVSKQKIIITIKIS